MEIAPGVQIAAFAVLSFIAVAGALGMATTMSMFRSGLFLMASFLGVAGLFILLLADLLAWLQVMMYIGGMLVMILFMVLFSHDPGGAMMAGMMKLGPLEKWFSAGLQHGDGGPPGTEHDRGRTEHGGQPPQHSGPDVDNSGHRMHHAGAGVEHGAQPMQQGGPGTEHDGGHTEHGGQPTQHSGPDVEHSGHRMHHAAAGVEHGAQPMQQGGPGTGDGGRHAGHGGPMDMSQMSMTTPIRRQAALLAGAAGLFLLLALWLRPSWPVTASLPDQNSAVRVGHLLMGKYMIAFEGAGLLILLGVFGALMVSRPAEHTGARQRERLRAAAEADPAPVESEPLQPVFEGAVPREEDA